MTMKDSRPKFAEYQIWKPDVFVCYSDSGRSIATTICDRLNGEWFLAASGSIDSCIEEINSCGVVMPLLTTDFDMDFLTKIKVPIVPVWPNNESHRNFGDDVPAPSTLDMTGTDFELSLVKACRRFPKEILSKRDFVASKIECGRTDEAMKKYPEYLFGKRPVDMQPRDWVAVLGKHPELCSVCDLSRFDGDDWQVLLCRQPSLANLCDWSLFNHESWCNLLRWQPQFASKCDFSGFTGEDWQSLLELQPQFGERCDWHVLDGHDWTWLLREQPQFGDRCDWPKLKDCDSSDICYMLEKQPQFIDRCNVQGFSGSDWRDLLIAQPQLQSKCEWRKLGQYDWRELLQKQPKLADNCNWERFTGENWSSLLGDQPQFADKCDWTKLNGQDWERLLRKQPQFSDWCSWEKLTGWDWAWLLIDHPEFSNQCNWSKFTGPDWVKLLVESPSFAEHCDWMTLGDNDWRELLEVRPQFERFRPIKRLDDDCSYYDIYICFDPSKTLSVAKRLANALETRGFGVYFNEHCAVDEEAMAALDVSRHFLLIRSEGLFDGIEMDDNPIARQLGMALERGLDVVFVGPSDQKWQDIRQLPLKLSSLQTQQVKILDTGDLFEEKIDAIVRECLSDAPGALKRKFDAFISYRRSTGAKFARKIQQGLKDRGCTSFLDYDSILNGKYDKVIHAAIDSAEVFLMLLTDNSLDRCCSDPDDWVAAEIRAAHARNMRIIPLTPDDQNWQLPDNLPQDLRWLKDVNPIVIKMGDGFSRSVSRILAGYPAALCEKCTYIEKIKKTTDYDEAERGLPIELPRLLKKYPDALQLFPYRDFSGRVWQQILAQVPELAYKCDWAKLDNFCIVKILREQPQFADKCKWENLTGFEIEILLEKQPQFANKCDFNLLDSCDMASLLCKQPQLAPFCDFSKMDFGGSWATLLKQQPQFADRCNWSLLEADDWVDLLTEQPQFKNKCDWSCIAGVGQQELTELISRRPQFLARVDWKNFSGEYLSQLLIEQPQLIEECDCGKFSGEDWARLIIHHPEFADRCEWGKLDDEEWEAVLEYQPELAKYKGKFNGETK